MGRWDDIEPMQVKEELMKVPVEGNFYCHVCNESVPDAIYLPSESILTWKCGTGHISSIKDINL